MCLEYTYFSYISDIHSCTGEGGVCVVFALLGIKNTCNHGAQGTLQDILETFGLCACVCVCVCVSWLYVCWVVGLSCACVCSLDPANGSGATDNLEKDVLKFVFGHLGWENGAGNDAIVRMGARGPRTSTVNLEKPMCLDLV